MGPLGPPNYAPGDVNPLTRWGLVSREPVVPRGGDVKHIILDLSTELIR